MNEDIGIENFDITQEEVQRFTKAFKSTEFRKLFADYCAEINDPENKRLFESELIQLEREHGVDVTFIHPEPGYVIKTTLNGKQKAFINVGKCDKIEKPSSLLGQNENGDRGLNWTLPYTQSPARRDFDKKQQLCSVYDVVFHPNALHLAEKNLPFKKLLTDTACNAVQTAFNVQLDLINLKFPNILYKGTAQPTIIRKKSKNHVVDSYEPSPIDQIYPPLKEHHVPVNAAATQEEEPLPTKKQNVENYTTPKYKLVHRKNIEYLELINDVNAKIHGAIPNEFVITIELPLLKSADDVLLDVTANSIFLISETPAKYKLKVNFPYPVDELAGTAKFDKQKRQLCITLPVLKPKKSNENDMANNDDDDKCRTMLMSEDSGINSDGGGQNNSIKADSDEEINSVNVVDQQKINDVEKPSISCEESKNDDSQQNTTATIEKTFLDPNIQYELPSFTCNTLDNTMAFTLQVKNVSPTSIIIDKQTIPRTIQVKFHSIGSGFFPLHYSFCIQFPAECGEILDVQPDAWDNNVILQIELKNMAFRTYRVGSNLTDFIEYTQEIDDFHNGNEKSTTKADEYDQIEVEVNSVSEAELKIQIKTNNPTQNRSKMNKTDTTTAVVDDTDEISKLKPIKIKRKNKKQRSYSESNCDDFSDELSPKNNKTERSNNPDPEFEYRSNRMITASNSIKIKSSTSTKMRTMSESSTDDNVIGGQADQNSIDEKSTAAAAASVTTITAQKSIKGILKRRSSFNRSISESSVDEPPSFYSCSVDLGVGSIPEEGDSNDKLSESCKKTVRFDNNIRKQLYKIRSSILGQRKPQANKRKKKKRSSDRRYSEGEASDYESKSNDDDEQSTKTIGDHHHHSKIHDGNQIIDPGDNNNNNNNNKKQQKQHDSGIDLTDEQSSSSHHKINHNNKNKKSSMSSHGNAIGEKDIVGLDLEYKSGMIFDIEM